MLGTQLAVELVFDLGEVSVGLAGDGYCLGLVPGGVGLDEVLEGIVVDVICARDVSATGGSIPIGEKRRDWEGGRTQWDGTTQRIGWAHYHVRRLHSGTDSLSKFWPYFIASAARMRQGKERKDKTGQRRARKRSVWLRAAGAGAGSMLAQVGIRRSIDAALS